MFKYILITLLPAVLIGALLALLTPGANYLASLFISSLLAWASLALLAVGWRCCGGAKTLGWMLALAFLLRLAVGAGLYALLPVAGSDSPDQKAGFLFADAFERDNQAWELAGSNLPVYAGLSQQFISDQYGGQLMLSALVYRYLSPDFHRPYLALILAAFAAAAGLLFLHQALRIRWGERTTNLAGWIYALYPESLLLGGSQLREPYLMALIAVGLWAVMDGKLHRLRAGLVFAASMGALFLFSSRVAAVACGILLVLGWFEYRLDDRLGRRRWISWVVLVLAAGLMLLLGWQWIQATARWDAYITERSSGWVQAIIDRLGEQWRIPFVSAYGLAQPVLPAALIYPGSTLARILVSFRAVGWYLLAPLLVYALFALRRVDKADRRVMAWLVGAVLVWVLISSMRAGGDQWDNPRYRTILIALEALLAAWSWRVGRDSHDPWLARLAAMEIIFVAPFTGWYYLRYNLHSSAIGFIPLAIVIAGLCAAVMIGGWCWDRRKQSVIKKPS